MGTILSMGFIPQNILPLILGRIHIEPLSQHDTHTNKSNTHSWIIKNTKILDYESNSSIYWQIDTFLILKNKRNSVVFTLFFS